jgi:DNA-binding MarR family transcriptional regulator
MKSGEQSGMGSSDELKLDSTYLIAFDMAHSALKNGLIRGSALNIMQYHVLVKVFAVGKKGISQTDLGLALDLKPNVVSQAVSVLEEAGYITRSRKVDGDCDGRVRMVRATKAGVDHAAAVNACIVEQLYTIFPTQNDLFRSILEASIAAGACIDPPLSEQAVNRFPASRALVSLELIRRKLDAILRRLAGVALSEYRILQRLSELGMPLRSVDLARQLRMSPAAVARSTDRLVAHAWATRLASPHDHKAVFVAATKEGVSMQRSIAATIDSLAHTFLWKNLNREQRHTIAQVGHVVIARLQEKEEAERREALSLLQPID